MTGPVEGQGQAAQMLNESTGPKGNNPSLYSQLASNRAREVIARPGTTKKERKKRTCPKCAKAECDGKKGASLCKNACRDCGQRSCRGRNSKAPTKKCDVAWND